MGLGTEQTERGLAALVTRMTDGFSRLVTQHLALARVELAQDARALGADVGRLAAFVPFVLVGYFFLCAALSVLLAGWLGWAGSLALVGGVNLVGGVLGILGAVSRLKAYHPLDDTAEELNRSVAVLAQAQVPPAVALPQEASRGR